MSYETASAHIILSNHGPEQQGPETREQAIELINMRKANAERYRDVATEMPDLRPRKIPSLYSERERTTLTYEPPSAIPLHSTKALAPQLNPDIFPEADAETGRRFTVELLEDSPELRAQRSPLEQQLFDETQEELLALDRTQRVLEYVGENINLGNGYMHRPSDEELAEIGGEELRPSTKFELKSARRLEKIERERREELHFAFGLADPDYAELSGRNAMTPPRVGTQKEFDHHENNRELFAHTLDTIVELDEEFTEIMTAPMHRAAAIREKYQERLAKQERSAERQTKIRNTARRIGNAVTSSAVALGDAARPEINTPPQDYSREQVVTLARERTLRERRERKQRMQDRIEVSRWAAQTVGSLVLDTLSEKSENLAEKGRSAKQATKKAAVKVRQAARPEINRPPRKSEPTRQQREAFMREQAQRNRLHDDDDNED